MASILKISVAWIRPIKGILFGQNKLINSFRTWEIDTKNKQNAAMNSFLFDIFLILIHLCTKLVSAVWVSCSWFDFTHQIYKATSVVFLCIRSDFNLKMLSKLPSFPFDRLHFVESLQNQKNIFTHHHKSEQNAPLIHHKVLCTNSTKFLN